MKVNLKFNSEEVQQMIKKYPSRIKKSSKVALANTAEFALNRIDNRTQRGVSVTGAPFVGYSKNYKKQGTVDLTDTGQMMSSLRVRSPVNHKLAIITLGRSEERRKAMWHHTGAGNLPVRKWFDISGREEILMSNNFSKKFMSTMSRLDF